jgi:CrcB protein
MSAHFSLTWLLALTLAAAIGTLARYAVGLLFERGFQATFPYATLTVNLCGSFLLGAVYGAWNADSLPAQIAYMALGAFTTFSTFNVEMLRLLQNGLRTRAMVYCLSSYGGGLLLAVCAYSLFVF